jgi:hypothetical protein
MLPYAWGMTYAIGPSPREITEDQLVEDQARVRALQIQRLELVWAVVEGRIRMDQEGLKPLDPRFAEIGLRALKEEALLYRLSKPAPVLEEEEDPSIQGVDRAELVLKALEDAEARLRGRDPNHNQDQKQDQEQGQHQDQ